MVDVSTIGLIEDEDILLEPQAATSRKRKHACGGFPSGDQAKQRRRRGCDAKRDRIPDRDTTGRARALKAGNCALSFRLRVNSTSGR